MAALLASSFGASAQATADPVVPAETIARLQLEDGTFTLTARGDGRITVAVLKLAPLDVAAADFSMPTLRALVESARRASQSSPGVAGPAVMLNSIDDRMAIGLDRRTPPVLIALRGRERVPVVLRLDAAVTVDTVASTIDRAIERARELTATHAPALVDATDTDFMRMSRSGAAAGAAPTSSAAARKASAGWSKADRAYFILLGAFMGGVTASAVAANGNECWDRAPCAWQQGAPGPVVTGTIVASTVAGLLSMRAGRPGESGCTRQSELVRVGAGALAGAIPGAVLAMRGERAGLLVMPVGQMAAILRLTNECANRVPGS